VCVVAAHRDIQAFISVVYGVLYRVFVCEPEVCAHLVVGGGVLL
jgi:hypothetical protein